MIFYISFYLLKLQFQKISFELLAFDQDHFKDAITLLYLNDKRENSSIDLELKKLINLQFQAQSDTKIWVVNLFDEVSHPVYRTQS